MALTKVDKSVSSTPGIVDNSDATAITIDSSENVGIGTSSPAEKLEVSGDIKATKIGMGISPIVPCEVLSTGTTSTALRVLKSGSNDSTQNNLFSVTEISGHGRLSIHDSSQNEEIRFDSNGVSYLSDGLSFDGTTTAASALNDYEEGSWTPTNADSGETANMGGDSARYTKIGNMVSLRFDITNTSGNHANLIGGLPYTVKTAAHGGIFIVYNNLSSGTSEYTTGYCNAGSTYIRLTVAGGVNSWQLNNGYRIIGFGVYETDS